MAGAKLANEEIIAPWAPKPTTPFSHAFSRAWRQLRVFASNSDWFIALFTSVVIGQGNYVGLTEKCSIVTKLKTPGSVARSMVSANPGSMP